MNVYSGVDEVAHLLGLSPSTIKKYYLLIEETGYRFSRTQKGRVMFSEKDIELFRKLIQIKNEKGMNVQSAVKQIVSSITDVTVWNEEVAATTFEPDKDITVMKDTMEKMMNIIQEQQKQVNLLLQKQENIDKFLEDRVSNRDKLLMDSIKETMEVKKILLEQKNKKWWNFWK